MDLADLMPKLREGALASKTSGEMLALAREEGYELSDEDFWDYSEA